MAKFQADKQAIKLMREIHQTVLQAIEMAESGSDPADIAVELTDASLLIDQWLSSAKAPSSI